MTDIHTPSYTTDQMAGTLEVSATSATTVHIKSLDGADLVINGIAVNFRAYMVRRENGTWFGEDLFAWRTGEFGVRATDNQTQKLYRMCYEIAESVYESFLHEGARSADLRELETIDNQIAALQQQAAVRRDHYIDLFDDEHLDDHCPTCTCCWSSAVTLDGFADLHCPSCTCHLETFTSVAPTRAILVVDDGVVDGLFSAGNAPALPLEVVQVNTGEYTTNGEDLTVVGDDVVGVRALHIGRVFHHDIAEAFEGVSE